MFTLIQLVFLNITFKTFFKLKCMRNLYMAKLIFKLFHLVLTYTVYKLKILKLFSLFLEQIILKINGLLVTK